MDYGRILPFVPHYLAMLVIALVATNLFDALIPAFGFWAEMVVIVAVVALYRPFVTWIGVAPDAWTESE